MAIRKPRFDTRPGVTASATARVWICGIICVVQYWLLTAANEAFHGGNLKVGLPAFFASLVCFVLVAGLIVVGESGSHKMQEELRDSE